MRRKKERENRESEREREATKVLNIKGGREKE